MGQAKARAKGRAMGRAERLVEMQLLYTQGAYSDSEMAERLGVTRSTVFRDRLELTREIPIHDEEPGRYHIDRVRYISNVRLSMSEAVTLYVAARRAAQQTRYAQEPAAKGLEKLATALQQPMTERLVNAASRILGQRSDPQRTQVFETVAQAWVEGRTMRLNYRSLGAEQARTHRFDTYLLEPSPWSDGVYLIGYSDVHKRVITLKLDRVEKAVLLGPFTVRPEFDEQAMLAQAWGIWSSDRKPAVVRLRFAPGRVARRLRETIWHPYETVTEAEDGSCIWEAPIAEWHEMLPWVRGWGADVEVLEPAALRAEMAEQARRMVETYGSK